MNYSQLLQTFAWTAVAVRGIFSPRCFGATAILVLTLAIGTTLLALPRDAHAQDAAVAPNPATVNINAADAEALAFGLNGIGPARAQEIVRYRESYGPFSSVDELTEVQGISKATLDKNRKVITLE